MLNKNKAIEYTPLYAEEIVLGDIPRDCHNILDFGSGDGHFSNKLTKKADRVYACDTDRKAFTNNKENYHSIKFQKIGTNCRTKYKSNFFDIITLMGVLEHVEDERVLLKELSRILKPGGRIYIYVINKGLLGFVDGGNLKFLFPGLHRFLWSLVYGKKSYADEFINKESGEMFGDFTTNKKWHTHYTTTDIDVLKLGAHLTRRKVWYYGMFLPFLMLMEFAYITFFKKLNPFISWLLIKDSHQSYGALSYSMVVLYVK